MRILIDMQGAQSESRFRGIGRYSLALALGIARNADDHEIWLVLNGALEPSIADLRRAFDGLVPAERIRVFDIPTPVAEINAANTARCRAAEMLREHFIEQLAPDMVLVTSLFEGYIDDSVVSAGRFGTATRTVVVLYDLIPFLNPNAYLGTPEQRQHYEGKIASLRSAGLLLAISDYTRQEAIDALDLDAQSVIAISTAVDDSFHPAPAGPALLDLRERCGITRSTIMYAPGGFDARKNIDGLIAAYSLLPAAMRSCHQLIIVSKLGESERQAMTKLAQRHGLASDELVLTGYVSDTELIDLYRSTALFVFPSKHEGFGLPALEAMACGAIVIGADNTSIPEVIGYEEAMFDAGTPASIAAKIAEVLDNPALQERLRSHGRAQAARFSWDATATKALRAMVDHHARSAPPGEPGGRSALVNDVINIPGLLRSDAFLHELAHCLASVPHPQHQRQFLFDVSPLLEKSETAMAAILRSQLAGMLATPLPGVVFEPVYLSESESEGSWQYRYARHFSQQFSGSSSETLDAPIDIGPADLLYSGGNGIAPPRARAAADARLRARGVKLACLVDLDTPLDACGHADLVLCTSPDVMVELESWLQERPTLARPPASVLDEGTTPERLAALLGVAANTH